MRFRLRVNHADEAFALFGERVPIGWREGNEGSDHQRGGFFGAFDR